MNVQPMTEQDARAIQAWTYEAPYDFYNQTPSEAGIKELMAYQAVHETGELIGFYCLGHYAQVPNDTYTYDDTYIDFGLGMRPDLTGQGHGRRFLETVLVEAKRTGKPVRLTVAAFNGRAVRLYEGVGFRKIASFEKDTTRFLIMVN
ncbi:GNAT family N-acetyltransferase [Exiguobacterium alkaliphilum]|uniref:GNAT family N-acetyltransferase n=1 Tax=Exiguobacterium alkaliphilum TaxID=1428684 RepID=UPI001BA75F5C|nr:GNAT family N-acetyltransferase [Exiguobacterium alkaliphilum]QUE86882.1 GNAT family N-acetyltransferase [Exiguobacterium alkaliphilum]